MNATLCQGDLGANTLSPRPYQSEAIDAARDALRRRKTALVVLPTGVGKTVVFSVMGRLCAERGGRTLVLAHMGKLVQQAANMAERAGLSVGIEQAESNARSMFDPHLVAATRQTMSGARLKSWPRDYFNLLVVDECHHINTPSYQEIINHFDSAKLVGVTATPKRMDGQRIEDVLGPICYQMSILDALTAPEPGPYLVKPVYLRCETPIDLRGLRTAGKGDYSDDEIAELIGPLADVLANEIAPMIGGRQAIVFTPDCRSASAMATAFQSLGLAADYLWGDSDNRDEKEKRYEVGETRIMCNAMLYTEGVDVPFTSAIVPLRPTKSESLYRQMIGRGLRIAPGKEDCLIIDPSWITDKHDLMTPYDLLYDGGDAETRAAFNTAVGSRETIDVVEESAKAVDKVSARRAIEVAARKREAAFKWTQVDPLKGAFEMVGAPVVGSIYEATHARPSERLVAALSKFGVPNADRLSKRNAKALMERLCERADAGAASLKQVKLLVRNGVPIDAAREMSRSEASARIDEIATKNGWAKKPRPEFQLRRGA